LPSAFSSPKHLKRGVARLLKRSPGVGAGAPHNSPLRGAALQDGSQSRVAALQCEQLMTQVKGLRLLTGLWQMDRLRALVGAVGDDLEQGRCTLVQGVAPQAFAHPFEKKAKKPKA
jgi:hypothetical protein